MEHCRASTEGRGYSAFLWLNLVCLDAPIVAVSWQWIFAKTFALPVDPASWAALFLTAWLIYLADRLGDSLTVRNGARLSLRQEFCVRHRKVWIWGLGLVAAIDAGVIGGGLNMRALLGGSVIGLMAIIYLILNHRWSRLWRVLPLKEVSIGVLFAGGTVASLLPTIPELTPSFAMVSILFALLCALNCACIARWERSLDLGQARSSIATAWPRVTGRVGSATVLFAVVALVIAAFDRHAAAVYTCLAFSAAGLAALDILGAEISDAVRTASADLVLLTPLAVFAWQALPALSS